MILICNLLKVPTNCRKKWTKTSFFVCKMLACNIQLFKKVLMEVIMTLEGVKNLIRHFCICSFFNITCKNVLMSKNCMFLMADSHILMDRSLEIWEFLCHLYFTWNQRSFWTLKCQKLWSFTLSLTNMHNFEKLTSQCQSNCS